MVAAKPSPSRDGNAPAWEDSAGYHLHLADGEQSLPGGGLESRAGLFLRLEHSGELDFYDLGSFRVELARRTYRKILRYFRLHSPRRVSSPAFNSRGLTLSC